MTSAWIIVARSTASVGLEDGGIELARRGSHLERGEEESGEEDADRLVASEQRDRDAGERDEVRGEVARSRPPA